VLQIFLDKYSFSPLFQTKTIYITLIYIAKVQHAIGSIPNRWLQVNPKSALPESTTTRKPGGLEFRPKAGNPKSTQCFDRCSCNQVLSTSLQPIKLNGLNHRDEGKDQRQMLTKIVQFSVTKEVL
jgi:hypothetical protein